MSIIIKENNEREFNILPEDIQDNCAYIDENGTIFIGALFKGWNNTTEEPVDIVAISLDAQDMVGLSEDRKFAAITISVEIVANGHQG